MIPKQLLPWSKSWIIRCAFYFLIHNDQLSLAHVLTWLEIHHAELSDDLLALQRSMHQYLQGGAIDVGESATLLRFWRATLWHRRQQRVLLTRGTLRDRQVSNDPSILRLPRDELLQLDGGTSQWASIVMLLTSCSYVADDAPYHLRMTSEAVSLCRRTRRFQPRHDETLVRQLEAFDTYRRTGVIKFEVRQAEDYCMGRAFGLITPDEGLKRFPQLVNHESNRITEMEEALIELIVRSKDHRVIMAIGMERQQPDCFTHPECVSKSCPQFWDILTPRASH